MWLKHLILTISLFLLAIIQSSFFTYFRLLEGSADLIFILFFLIIFFEAQEVNFVGIFYSYLAGIILDVSTMPHQYLGVSAIIFLIMYILFVKLYNFLRRSNDKYPFFYFVFIFIVWCAVFEILQLRDVGLNVLFSVIYNLILATIGFYIFKQIYVKKV